MEHKRSWVAYVVVRVLSFAVPFAIVMLALPAWQYNWLVGLVAGTLVGLCVSYIFLQRQRQQMGSDLAGLRERRDLRTADERAEDELVDGASADAPTSTDSGSGNDGASSEPGSEADVAPEDDGRA